MARPVQRKDHRVSMWLADADVASIERAARMRGRSRAEFMRDAAVRMAQEVLMANTVIGMPPEGFAAFAAMLDSPAKPVAQMAALLKRPAPWEAKAATE